MANRKCENCGNENIEIITKEIGYSCPKCGRNTVRMADLHQTNAVTGFMEEFIKALQRFDSLETVIAELKAYDSDRDRETTIENIVEFLNDEADYANY